MKTGFRTTRTFPGCDEDFGGGNQHFPSSLAFAGRARRLKRFPPDLTRSQRRFSPARFPT